MKNATKTTRRAKKNGAPAPDAPSAKAAPNGSTAAPRSLAVSTGAVGSVALPLASRMRIPYTVDPQGDSGGKVLQSLQNARVQAIANLFTGIQQVHGSLSAVLTALSDPLAPAQLISSLAQPDGSAGASLQIQFDPSTLGSSSPVVTTISDKSGSFQLNLPSGMRLPGGSAVQLTIHGATSTVQVSIPASHIAANGLVPALILPQYIASLQSSLLASLEALASSTPAKVIQPDTNPPQLPAITLGEQGDCALKYGLNSSVDRFPFGVFYRLVEPRASIVSQTILNEIGHKLYIYLPQYETSAQSAASQGQVSYVDRIPVEQPVSVDGFRDQLMGLQQDGTFTADETRPMAGTLGLGYTLWLAQQWTFQGLALGNLVYSLPLAPGEQQQVAIFERTDTEAVYESESFTEEEQIQQSALADTSTNATFNSAFNEAVNGSSSFHTDSSSSSWGGSLILISGGSGSSSSDGTTQSSLQGQRNTTQQAAQTTHSAAENQASARRSAARTGMRVATASESQQVTTKTITNHNHTRALTMQYWEVQRLYDVTTTIEGLTMTVLVPLQVVRFMPAGQPQTLLNPNQLANRQQVLERYSVIIKHGDVLAQALPRKYVRGLEILQEFAGDPSAQVDSSSASAEDVIQFSISGSFLFCETVTITVVTARGTRVGPAYLTRSTSEPPKDTFSSQDELAQWLTDQRQGGAVTLSGAVALPPSVTRSDVVGFEVQRYFEPVSYTLAPPQMATVNFLKTTFPTLDMGPVLQTLYGPGNTQRTTVTLSPSGLESLLGGPVLTSFSAQVSDGTGTNEAYTQSGVYGVELPQQAYPIAAAHVPPVLKYQQILEIEKMATHVVRRTLTYSKAIWTSMSPEERAIMLEAYTIGVPPGGIQDSSQMVPLLNCVENRVLGFFGNSMMLPFIIPESLTKQINGNGNGAVDPAKIEEVLLAFHKDGFTPPRSIVALPTRGVLGEAVLGNCPSAEKIDLTRFWNWQDSPSDSAPAIAPVTLPTSSPSLTAGLTAPNSLTNLPSLINNVLTAPTPDTTLLQALGKNAASQQDFSTALTNAGELAGLLTNAQNNANSARADALKTTKDLTSQTIATVANLVGGGQQNSNPNAGSNALAAQNGQKPATTGGTGSTAQGKNAGGKTNTGQSAGPPGTGTTSGPGGAPGTGSTGGTSIPPGGAMGGLDMGSIADLAGGLDAGSLADLAVLAARRPAGPSPRRPGRRGATAVYRRLQEDSDNAF